MTNLSVWTQFTITVEHDPNSGTYLESFQEPQSQYLQNRLEELVALVDGKYGLKVTLTEQIEELTPQGQIAELAAQLLEERNRASNFENLYNVALKELNARTENEQIEKLLEEWLDRGRFLSGDSNQKKELIARSRYALKK